MVTVFNLSDCIILHPQFEGRKITIPETANPVLKFGTVQTTFGSTVFWQLSDVTVKGVWVANTLPVPAVNVFLDQDLPPYIGNGMPPGNLNGIIGVAGNGLVSDQQ